LRDAVKAWLIKSLARTFGVAGLCTMLTVAAAAPFTGEEGDAVLSELKQIRHFLEQQLQAPSATRLSAPLLTTRSVSIWSQGYWIGRADAPLTLVEYTDYQCPFCRPFHITTRRAALTTGHLFRVVPSIDITG
jgi:protein-disulfide isomerase